MHGPGVRTRVSMITRGGESQARKIARPWRASKGIREENLRVPERRKTHARVPNGRIPDACFSVTSAVMPRRIVRFGVALPLEEPCVPKRYVSRQAGATVSVPASCGGSLRSIEMTRYRCRVSSTSSSTSSPIDLPMSARATGVWKEMTLSPR
jgi:hypothetical protein